MKEFVYEFNVSSKKLKLRVPSLVVVSSGRDSSTVSELAHRVIHCHNLLPDLYEDLCKQIVDYRTDGLIKEKDEQSDNSILKFNSHSLVQVVEDSNLAYSNNVLRYKPLDSVSNDSIFREVYNSLVHSSCLDILFRIENQYARKVERLIALRDQKLESIVNIQRKEMEDAIRNLNLLHSEDFINRLAMKHIENYESAENHWSDELNRLRESQEREYRNRTVQMHEEIQIEQSSFSFSSAAMTSSPAMTSSAVVSAMTPSFAMTSYAAMTSSSATTLSSAKTGRENSFVKRFSDASLSVPNFKSQRSDYTINERREESFTVHLGAQMKTSHNLRLISCDILDLCRNNSSEGQPEKRLQTTLSLYSSRLSGLVILVDDRISSYTGIKKDFARICEQSTDFHFPCLEHQLQKIESCLQEVKLSDFEQNCPSLDRDRNSFATGINNLYGSEMMEGDNRNSPLGSDFVSSGKSGEELYGGGGRSSDEKPINNAKPPSKKLKAGDLYMTRHSNLSEVHVIFHLVTDMISQSEANVGDMSSRHPIIGACRNVIKTCFRHDIKTVTFPLLLVTEMTEEMTIPWCLKRAELVFKCIKGFVMELLVYSTADSFTIQFLVPKTLSNETFACLSNMMPSIFRMSNPVIAK